MFLRDVSQLEKRGLVHYHHTDVIELKPVGLAVADSLHLPSDLADLERKVVEIGRA